MNCEQFINRLDNGEFKGSSAENSQNFLDHAKSCDECQKALNKFEKIVTAFQSVKPDELNLSRLQMKIFKLTTQSENHLQINQTNSRPGFSLFDFFGKNPAFAAIGLITLVITGFLIFTSHAARKNTSLQSPSGEVAYLSGGASVISGENKLLPVPQGRELPLVSGDKFIFSNNPETVLKFPDGRGIRISGKGECSISESLQLEKGAGDFAFQGSMIGYRVQLQTVKLVILGTKLHLKTEPASDQVWVQEGKISWETPGGQKGSLVSGNGIKFSSGKLSSITSSPLTEYQNNIKIEVVPTIDAPTKPILPGN